MDLWPCACPLCRIFVHPILRLFIPNQEQAKPAKAPPEQHTNIEGGKGGTGKPNLARPLEVEMDKKALQRTNGQVQEENRENENRIEKIEGQQNANTSRSNGSNQQEPRLPNIAGPIQPQVQPKLEEVRPTIPEEVKERIEKLEKELGRLRSELKEALDSITDALIDVRAAVVENINPFLATNGGKPMLLEFNVSMDINHITEMVRMLNETLDKFNSDILIELIDSLAESGSISEASARTLKALVKAVSEMKRKGIDVNEQIRLITLILSNHVKSNRGGQGG